MRVFDQDQGAAALIDVWRVHYDAVRVHQAVSKTLAQAA
jgi:hypothetical protein